MTYFHIRITQKSGGPDPLKLDFNRQDLEQRVLRPYREGRPITISGKTTTTDDIEQVKITTTVQNSAYYRTIAEQKRNSSDVIFTPLEWDIINMGDDVTDDFMTGPPGSGLEERPTEVEAKDLRPPADTREVFVVHGRNLAARDALFEFLRAVDPPSLGVVGSRTVHGQTCPVHRRHSGCRFFSGPRDRRALHPRR